MATRHTEKTLISRSIQANQAIISGESCRDRTRDLQWICEPLDFSIETIRQTVARLKKPVILESTLADAATSRWSIFAADPIETLVIRNDRAMVTSEFEKQLIALKPRQSDLNSAGITAIQLLKLWFKRWLWPYETGDFPLAAPFRGGLLGWVGYDFGWQLEKLPRLIPDRDSWDDLRLGVYDTFICYDHKHHRATLLACDMAHASQHRNPASQRIKSWQNELEWTSQNPRNSRWNALTVKPVLSRDAYEQKICRVLDYLAAGDIFQANFTHRFEADGPGDPLALYSRLAQISPAPFAAYLQWHDRAIISSSPEWFYRVDGRRVLTRPIKGTRPRGSTLEADAANRAELLSSTKDRAELTMIVDLERNDLGRVAEFGSVRVNEAMKLESYAQVHHLVAEIEARLRKDQDEIDLLAAMFPGGSITGAPKIRAMEIIEELETHRRGPYTGSIGYISLDGNSAWNIAIRTIVKNSDLWSYNVGGGIVIDSDPGEEYEETLTKGRGMRQAIEGATNA